MSYGNIPKSSDIVPMGAVIVPGDTVPRAIKAGNILVDTNSNTLASICSVADGTTVLNQASSAKTANGSTADLAVGAFRELLLGFNITNIGGTGPTIQFSMDTKGPDGIYYTLYSGSTYTTQPQKVLASLGVATSNNVAFGSTIRINWIIGGTTPSWTFSLWLIAK